MSQKIEGCCQMGLILFILLLHSLVLQLNFVSTWGDPYYMGLTGIELLGANQEAIPLSYNMLKVRPEFVVFQIVLQQEQGGCSGEIARVSPLWPEFGSGLVPYVGRVCCWFLPCSSPRFLPLKNPTIPNSNSTLLEGPHNGKVRTFVIAHSRLTQNHCLCKHPRSIHLRHATRDVIIESYDLYWLTVNQLKHLMNLETYCWKTKKTIPSTVLVKYWVQFLQESFYNFISFLILKRHAQRISMTFQNTTMTIEHSISKYLIKHCIAE